MSMELDSLFRPRSIAVVGASRKRGSIGAEVFHNIMRSGFSGPVYPVHPSALSIQAVRAYPTVGAIPDPVDLAVLVVPKEAVLAVVDDCHKKGVKGLLVITAGFGEVGDEGRALQNQLLERVRSSGMRMVGPNCLGVLNREAGYCLNATFAPAWPPYGNVAFSSQSGALGLAILDYASDLGIGISMFASVGNKADVSGNDLLEYWEADDNTRVILLYLESFGNPRRFMEIAKRVSQKKPIVVVKSGRTESGARAASSHTGSLAGLDVAVDALLLQAGVTRTDTIEEMFDLAMLLANQPVPKGNRVAILTNAGGPGIMASDACESRGLVIPDLSSSTVSQLRAFLPATASVRNPVDMIASATAESYEKAVRLLLQDEGIDAAIVLFVPPVVTEAKEVAEAICRGAAGANKTVLTCFMGTHGVPAALSSLRQRKFPSYAFPESAAIALARAVRYGAFLAEPKDAPVSLQDADSARARTAMDLPRQSIEPQKNVGQGRWLSPKEVNELVQAYKISAPAMGEAHSEEEAARVASGIGFPVALKLMSKTITHKTDVGGIVLNLQDVAGVKEAFQDIKASVVQHGRSDAFDGVLVQAMASKGVELFVGVTRDPVFGPLVGFGMGGVHVELWKDVVFRVHPITRSDIAKMVREIRGYKLLEGFRGQPAVDLEQVQEVLLRVNHMLTDIPEIVELDINPLLAHPKGQGISAVDVRVRVAECG